AADLTVTSTTSAPLAAAASVASAGVALCVPPCSSLARSPSASSAITRCRPLSVTSTPPADSRPPIQHPIAPAPNTAMRLMRRTYIAGHTRCSLRPKRKTMMFRSHLLAIAIACASCAGTGDYAIVETSYDQPPPPLREEVVVYKPGFFWV